jgi:hypothetical protein
VKAAAPLAIYFSSGGAAHGSIGPKQCAEMGQAMSGWYFSGGGLLLSEDSRRAYFRLARALTRASLARDLRAPTFPKDAEAISAETLDEYRKELSKQFDLENVESWMFGEPADETTSREQRFKDYIFLQQLSSALRTALSEDLRSRRRPST